MIFYNDISIPHDLDLKELQRYIKSSARNLPTYVIFSILYIKPHGHYDYWVQVTDACLTIDARSLAFFVRNTDLI